MQTPTSDSTPLTFGGWLKSQRRDLDWTQDDLAVHAFCSVSTIRKIETGNLTPSRSLAEQLAVVLSIPAAQQPGFLDFARGLKTALPSDDGQTGQMAPMAAQGAVLPKPDTSIYRPPAPLTGLIGREREIQRGCALLRRADVRLVTLVGPPGAGKTRLSLALGEALAAEFAQGVCFVPLAPITDAALVLSALADSLHLRELTGVPLAQTLHDFLRGKRLLLILDNFEQVVDAAPLVADLLEAAPNLKVLVSSREALHLYGEHEFPVSPLAVPDIHHLPTPDLLEMYPAVELFVQRAQAVRPNFVVDVENADAIAHICAWLDGLPLAIEMAAAHVKWKPPAILLDQLRQQLMALTGGQRDLSPRQQTLRGAIDWSYNLLSPAEQGLVMAMGVVNGGCTLAVAGELSDLDSGVCARLLRGLAEKSLIQWAVDDLGEPRVAMLQMIREYAQAKAEEAGIQDRLRERHAAIYHRLVAESLPRMRGAEIERVLNRLEIEHNNLRSALGWYLAVDSGSGLALATLLADSLWTVRGHFGEGRAWLEKLLAEAPAGAQEIEAEIAPWIALADMAMGQGDLPGALIYAAQIDGLARASENDAAMRTALRCRAVVALHQSDYAQASQLYQQTLALCGPGDQIDAALSLNGLGLIAKDQGDFAAALAYHERGRAAYAQVGDAMGVARTLTYASIAAYWQGAYELCVDLASQAIQVQQEVGDVMYLAYSRDVQGMALVRMGQFEEGIAILEESAAAFRGIGERSGTAVVLTDLGQAAYLQQAFGRSLRAYREALEIACVIGDRRRAAFCLEGFGMALTQLAVDGRESDVDEKMLAQAVTIFAGAESLRHQISSPLPPSEREIYAACRAVAAAHLSTSGHAEAWAQGTGLRLDQVVALVIDR